MNDMAAIISGSIFGYAIALVLLYGFLEIKWYFDRRRYRRFAEGSAKLWAEAAKHITEIYARQGS